MYPILFEIGPLTIRTYGLLLAISFMVGIILALRRSRERGLNQNQMINMCLLIMLAGIIGARIMYVIPHWNEFSANPLDIISPFQSSGAIGLTGLTMYGGFIAAILVSVLYLRWNRLSVWKACDAFVPSIALGIGISRVGCFLNGCCFGLPPSLHWVSPSGIQRGGLILSRCIASSRPALQRGAGIRAVRPAALAGPKASIRRFPIRRAADYRAHNPVCRGSVPVLRGEHDAGKPGRRGPVRQPGYQHRAVRYGIPPPGVAQKPGAAPIGTKSILPAPAMIPGTTCTLQPIPFFCLPRTRVPVRRSAETLLLASREKT